MPQSLYRWKEAWYSWSMEAGWVSQSFSLLGFETQMVQPIA